MSEKLSKGKGEKAKLPPEAVVIKELLKSMVGYAACPDYDIGYISFILSLIEKYIILPN
jgi:hypothetical protein